MICFCWLAFRSRDLGDDNGIFFLFSVSFPIPVMNFFSFCFNLFPCIMRLLIGLHGNGAGGDEMNETTVGISLIV